MNTRQIEAVKKVTKIESASCLMCGYISSDDDGSEYCLNSWPVCSKNETYQYLKSFPFKKDMKCWWPEFWGSKFSDLIKKGEDYEFDHAVHLFRKSIETALIYVEVETRHMWE